MHFLTYPPRPVNGGPLEKALPKTGDWSIEPKYNGWRTLVHVPTGAMFNRKGRQLSIAHEFRTALDILKKSNLEWADCEGLERRHNIGRGTLIVFDVIVGTSQGILGTQVHRLPLSTRRQLLYDELVASGIAEAHNQHFQPEHDMVYIPPCYGMAEAPELWAQMKAFNQEFKCDFYEGLVTKRNDSTYPIQLRSPDESFPFWMKHRWAF